MLPDWEFHVMWDGGCLNCFPEPKSYFLRFSDKHANGFLLYLTVRLPQRLYGLFCSSGLVKPETFDTTKLLYI